MGIGMIAAGMTEGLGAGMVAASKEDAAAELLRQKSDANLNAQLQVLEAKRAASMEVLMAKLEAKGAGGEGKAQPIDQANAMRFAAMDTGSTGDQVRQRLAIADGAAPTRDIPGLELPAPGAVDTAAVGENGEDYSDAMTRRLQHAAAKPTVIGQEVDQAAMDDYKANAAAMVSSLRRSANPKESKNMAEAGAIDDRRGHVNKAVQQGLVGPGEAALLSDGKAAYNKDVSLATGRPTDVGKSEIRKNDGAAAKDRSEADLTQSGGIKPKDQKDWLDNERKAIDTQRADIRRRESDLDDIKKSILKTDEEKAAERAQLKQERQEITQREQAWQAASKKIGANIMGATATNPGTRRGGGVIGKAAGLDGGTPDTDAISEKRILVEQELETERAKPIGGEYTQAKKNAAIEGLQRELADIDAGRGGMVKVNTSRMPGAPAWQPGSAGGKPAAPAAPAAAAAPKGGAYKSPADVKAAYQAGQLTKDQARAALSQFGFK